MTDAILSRPESGGASVTIPLLGEPGNLALSRDIGKPALNVHSVGREDPLTQDFKNAQDVWTLAGVFLGDTAYADARTLAESVIKPRLPNPLTLDLSAAPGRGVYQVVPNGASALSLTYAPGELDIVGVQCSLSAVQDCQGGTQDAQAAGAPPDGAGVRIARGTTSVDLDVDTALTRSVGRPGIQLNPNTNELPIAIDENAPAEDAFEVSGVLVEGAASAATTLEEEILRPQLGTTALTLSFLGETFGLGEYSVVPSGSQAARTVISTATEGEVRVPKLELRQVSG